MTDPELFTKICEHIAEGDSVRKAAERVGIDPAKFYRALATNEDLAKQYAGARANRADSRVESMDDVIEDLKANRIDANQARVIMDAIKWQAGKENGKRYGDKIDLNHSGDITVEFK